MAPCISSSSLKEAFFLPSKNPPLFLSLYALILLLLGGILTFHALVVAPTLLAIAADFKDHLAVSGDLLLKLALDGGRFLFGLLAFQAILAILGLQSAAATLAGGEPISLLDLLKNLRSNKSPFLTVLVVYILLILYVAAVAGVSYLGSYLYRSSYLALAVVAWILAGVLLLFFIYLAVVCASALAASVVEAGVGGVAAVKVAWALLKPAKHSAFGLAVVFVLLDWATRPLYMYALLQGYFEHRVAVAAVLAVVYLLLAAAVEVYAICAVVVFYTKCRSANEEVLLLYTAIPADPTGV